MRRSGELQSLTTGPVDMIRLTGEPERIGALWGALNRDAICHDLEYWYLEPASKAKLDPAALIQRSQRFVEIAGKLAPHWLAEARAVAAEAGVDPDLYVSFIANVYRGLHLADDCTSYSVSPDATAGHRVFFHKNRDNARKDQCAFILASAVEGLNQFIATSDASVITCMMMVNDKGLAGSADTGGLPVERPQHRGVMNTFILRHVAERAATCDEALQTVREFVAGGWYAGGGKTGTHWLFVDRNGRRLEVSNNSDKVTYRYHTKKVYFSARDDGRAARMLRAARTPIDFAAFHNASRDPSTCFESSVAGMSVEINPQHPDLLTCAWVSLPAKGLSFPLFMGGGQTPLPLLDGSVFTACEGLDGERVVWERVEASAFADRESLARDAAASIEAGDTDRARSMLDAWVRTCTTAHLAALTG